ncbi:MAG: hypothetical protein EAZ66_07515, partial [Alphaproteobacteria bacterium]
MQCPHRYPLIFNPKARSQKSGRVLRFLMEHANRFAIYATNHAGEAHDLAARFAARGEPVVIAAGGDGTLNEVVRGLAGSETVLGILPAGTMVTTNASKGDCKRQECDANGNCFQPTVFNWQVSQLLPHGTAQQTVGVPNSTKPYVYGDFTGDGLVDVIRYEISETQQPGNQYSRTATVTLQFYINNGDKTFTLRDTKIVSELYYSFYDEDIKVRTAELNGDNIDDVV